MAQVPDPRRSASPFARALVALGGLVALVTGTGAAGVAAAPSPDTPGEGDVQPAGAQDASTGAFEACSANFGYGKGRVAEVVVEVDGAVPSPPLTYPADVQLVAEFEDSGATQMCAPDVVTPDLWASKSLWAGVFGIDAPMGNYVFMPRDLVPVTLRLVGAPDDYSVRVGQAVVEPLSVDLDAALQSIMSVDQWTALNEFVFATTNGQSAQGCDPDGTGTPSADLEGAQGAIVAALEPAFLAYYEVISDGRTPCGQVDAAIQAFGFQVRYHAEVGRQAVFELAIPEEEHEERPAAGPPAVPEAIRAAITFTG